MTKMKVNNEGLEEALIEARENALASLKRYSLIIFTELNQPMRYQRDDLETIAYYINKYTEALDVFDDGYPEVCYKWLQRLEADIDYSTQSLDVVWEKSEEELDVADAFLQEIEDGIKDITQKINKKWEEEGEAE